MNTDLTNPIQPEVQATAPAPQALFEDSTPAAPPRPWFTATRILILTNLVVFASAMVEMGSDAFFKSGIGQAFPMKTLLAMGSDYGPLTLDGQYWRVISAIFLHINFVHLFLNIFFLWVLGRALERIFSRGQALAIFLLTGIAGSLASLGWHPMVLACGASGIVYGQAGVLAALFALTNLDWPTRDKNKVLVCMIFLLPFGVLFGRLPKNVDYAAHVGGFVAGAVIGILLARTLQMPQPQRKGRQWRFLVFVLEGLVVMFVLVVQLRGDVFRHNRDELPLTPQELSADLHKPKVTRVFMQLKGEPKLVRRLEGFLKLELEDAGIQTADREDQADGLIRGEVAAERQSADIIYGEVQMQVTAGNRTEKMDSCATLSNSENTELFKDWAETAAQDLRKKYPNGHTVKLDPAGGTGASKEFGETLPDELKSSDFTVTNSLPADLVLRVNLVRQTVPLEESVVRYRLSARTRKGRLLDRESGSRPVLVKLAGPPPGVCPGRFSDLTWLQDKDVFYSAAKTIVEKLRGDQKGNF